MTESLVSVIIPVYNVEEWIAKSVRSVMRQTYQNLEIILIDDGSPDKCPEMCDIIGKEDKRVNVIHKLNGGLSDARNSGILVANGDYVMFLDSDDWIAPDIVELLYRSLVKYSADISECSFTYVYKDYNRPYTTCTGETIVVSPIESLNLLNQNKCFLSNSWAKLIRREIMQGISFPKGYQHEDEFTTYKYHLNANKLVYTDVFKYYYNQRGDSIMNRPFTIQRLDGCEAYSERLHLYFNMGLSELWDSIAIKYCWSVCYSLQKCIQNELSGNRLEETINRAIIDYRCIREHNINIKGRYDDLMQSLSSGRLDAFKQMSEKRNYLF